MFFNVGIVLTGVQWWVFCNVGIVLTYGAMFCNVGIVLTCGAMFFNVGIVLTGVQCSHRYLFSLQLMMSGIGRNM